MACLRSPELPACAGYAYPNATADLLVLCMTMPTMSGCSVRKQCELGSISGRVCMPLSLLGDACTEMPGMPVCVDGYDRLCALGSRVLECSQHAPIAGLPSGADAQEAVEDMCADQILNPPGGGVIPTRL